MRYLRMSAKAIAWLLGLLVAAAIVGLAFLWMKSPGEAQPITDADGASVAGSISRIDTVEIGGVDQRIIVRGRDADAPVMLFLHGGPGSPEYAFLRRHNPDLEDHFVMVYWEQRGAGMSFDPAAPLTDLTLETLVSDTAELAGLLRTEFEADKIFLMGHSFGSLLGMLTIRDHPEHFEHYFGVGQIADMHEGEAVGLAWALEQARTSGNTDATAELEELTVPDIGSSFETWMGYIGPQRKWLDRLGGGTTHEPTSFLRLVGMVLATPEYSLSDKGNFMRGSRASLGQLWNPLAAIDLREELGPVDVPVTILHGAWDFVTPRPLAEELFETLVAPDKELVIFEASAHSPLIEESERFNVIVLERAGMTP